MIAGFKDENILIFGFLMVEDLIDFESHGLAGPHARNLAEPTICEVRSAQTHSGERGSAQSCLNTLDGWMCDFGHCSSTSVLDVPLEASTVRPSVHNEEVRIDEIQEREDDIQHVGCVQKK